MGLSADESRENVLVCRRRIKILGRSVKVETKRLVKYSMQLAMLRQLLAGGKITETEYRKIKQRLKKDYGIVSDITTCK